MPRLPDLVLIGVCAAWTLASATPALADEDGAAASAAHPYQLILSNPQAYRLRLTDDFKLVAGRDTGPRPAGAVHNAPDAARPYLGSIAKAAAAMKLEPALVHAVIAVESGYNPKALSPKGASGLMQLMPDTARRYGLRKPERESKQPDKNIRAGTAYLRDLMQRFDNDVKLTLAAYNAGENAVIRSGFRIPPYRETRDYVPRVLELYEKMKPPPAPTTNARVRKTYPPPPGPAAGDGADARL